MVSWHVSALLFRDSSESLCVCVLIRGLKGLAQSHSSLFCNSQQSKRGNKLHWKAPSINSSTRTHSLALSYLRVRKSSTEVVPAWRRQGEGGGGRKKYYIFFIGRWNGKVCVCGGGESCRINNIEQKGARPGHRSAINNNMEETANRRTKSHMKYKHTHTQLNRGLLYNTSWICLPDFIFYFTIVFLFVRVVFC